MLTWAHYLILFAIALVVTVLLVPVVRKVAVRFGVVDEPGPRRVNKVPIPRMGGVAMYFGLLVATLAEYAFEAAGLWDGPLLGVDGPKIQSLGLLAGVTAIVVVGVLDDVFSLKPIVKFCGQILASCIIAFTGTLLMRFHLPFSTEIVSLGVWAYPITVIYLVCFINVINLIDGLDGLAAGVSAIAAFALFLVVITLFRTDAALFAIIIMGCCIAFLFYNFNPASIFMGDSGSMMLGLSLGTISLLGAARFASVTIMLVPILVALVPIIDTFGAIVRRLRKHQSIATADAGHIHHRLLLRGYSQRKVVLLVYAWTAFLSLGALLMWEVGGVTKYVVLVVLLLFSAIVVWRLGLFGPTRIRHGRKDVVYESHEERAARRKAAREAKAAARRDAGQADAGTGTGHAAPPADE